MTLSKLQHTRLYVQGRPLVSFWRKDRRNIAYQKPHYISLIDQEITGDYISLDCSGWYFANPQRKCTAIELYDLSKQLWPDVIFEYDYLTWRPDYLGHDTVLAYHSSYFRYSQFDDIVTFFNIWGPQQSKLIIGLDPTKVKFNYLKYNFLDLLSERLQFDHKINILEQSNFNLLFTFKKI